MSEFLTTDQVSDVVKAAVSEAVKAANTVAEEARPAAPVVSNVNRNRLQMPDLAKAIRAAYTHNWKGAELERDISQAVRGQVPWQEAGDADASNATNALTLPTTVKGYQNAIRELKVRTPGSEAAKALGDEGVTVDAGTSAGVLTPPEWLTDRFALTLTSATVLRQMPDVQVIPVTKQVVEWPYENVRGVAASYGENSPITPDDPTLGMREYVIRKQAELVLASNEAVRDADVSLVALVQTMLARNIGLLQDQQFLDGTGQSNQILGISQFPDLTTSSVSAGAPTADDILAMLFDIYGANAHPTALVMSPFAYKYFLSLKDGVNGRYIFTTYQQWGGPLFTTITGNDGRFPQSAVGNLNGVPVYLSTQIPVDEGYGNDETHIFVGDWSRAFILERQAIDLFVSEHYAMNSDQVAIRGVARSAIALSHPKAFSVATGLQVG